MMDYILVMRYDYLFHKGKRSNNSKDMLRKELINFIKEESEKGHFPSGRELERKFHFRLRSLFQGIEDLYYSANLAYKLAPNQDLKVEKANLLLKLVLDNIDKFGLTLICYRRVREKGIDIVGKEGGKRVGIELKAYNSGEKLKSKDINQVLRFINKENLSRAIIITTTNLKEKHLTSSKVIDIIDYDKLHCLVGNKCHKKLNYIRDFSVNVTNPLRGIKRQKILDYVFNKYSSSGYKPTYNDILKNLNLDLYSYFSSLSDIYKSLEIPPPTRNMGGKRAKNPDVEVVELWKTEFKKYILEEIRKKGRYPSGEDIGKHCGVSFIWNITSVSELYKELGLKPYKERSKRNITSCLNV